MLVTSCLSLLEATKYPPPTLPDVAYGVSDMLRRFFRLVLTLPTPTDFLAFGVLC